MLITDMKRVVEQISRDKGIDADVLIKTLEEALCSAARKKFGSRIDIEAQYNESAGDIEVFQFKEVVEEVDDEELEITIDEGRKLDPQCELGDSLGLKLDTSTFGRIAAQSAKQVIIQKMKEAEREAIYGSFIDRKGEIINGIVQRMERGDIIVNLGQTEAALPVREQVPREAYHRGDRIRALILKVLHESRGPQVVLSRTHPDFIANLFKTEVPEISEGIVSIMGAAREAGSRAKIAVKSSDPDIDPVGACVGMKGSRVQSVVQELRGEKIDIIPWNPDIARFVCNALAPAEISRVIIDEDNRSMEVIVPDEFLSVAIGKRGQNVRLASKLTGWHLDVKNEEKYSQAMKAGFDSLMNIDGVGLALADLLYGKGFFSPEEVSRAEVEDLAVAIDITEESAEEIIRAATAFMEAPAEEPEDAEAPDSDEPAEEAGDSVETTGETESASEETEPGEDGSVETDFDDESGEDVEPDASVETDSGDEPGEGEEPDESVDTDPGDESGEEPAEDEEPNASDDGTPEEV